MSKNDKDDLARGQVRNEEIALPASLTRFLDERAAAVEDDLAEPLPGEPPVDTPKDAEKRAEINRRILEKLGILSEVEELQKLDAKRSRSSR
jgi:hypothetical protein